MKEMIAEIMEIPVRAWYCYENTRELLLPSNIPYLGMGSSFIACLTLKHRVCDGPLCVARLASGENGKLLDDKLSPI